MTGVTGSTVPRRQLGRHLRELRNRARLTARAASTKLEWSEPKLWRIETGQTSLRSLDVEAMCKVYGAPAELTQALMGLAKETKSKGWWHSYGDVIPEFFDLYVGLEEAASSLQWYESQLVPGLLQTPDYARTLIRAYDPARDEEEVERRTQVSITRQVLLTRVTDAPKVDVVLNEGVLHCPVGSPKIMADQLNRLADLNDLDNVSIRVVPHSVGLHKGMTSGPFVLMRFPTTSDGRDTEPPTIYVEGFTGSLYLDKPNEIERYDTAFKNIWGSALDQAGSTSLFKRAAKELGK
ncbi:MULTISPECIES: helix-turn-helix transcriptional regulator [unclassified Streptomyces]|uniref:helix-turn-helix domain-containing protein n=1 Tax=unclassified Streptomyces TaxID=2593676 RepID=UPI001EFCA890|nr:MULTISPECIES: helix-turn-helix transcriptional regulator [unclassified Streptomyces]